MVSSTRKAIAEVMGTFWLVFAGVGSAVLAGAKVGNLGVGLAFGLTVLTMAYAIGHISGAHLNPAVSVGLAAAGRIPFRELPVYIISQLVGATLGSWVVLLIARSGPEGYIAAVGGLGANGYGLHSPGGYSAAGVLLTEIVMTFIFLMVILGATSKRGPTTFAGIAIGFCLALIHIVAIPVDNLSVNPARSTGPALFVGGWAMRQLWMFWVAPLIGAVLAGLAARLLEPDQVLRKAGAQREGPPGGEVAVSPRPTKIRA